MKYNFASIPVNLVDVMWDQMESHLQLAVDEGDEEVSIEEVYNGLISGQEMAIIVAVGSDIVACITISTFVYRTGLKVLNMPLVGGTNSEMLDWMPELIAVLEIIAKELGCTQIRGYCARRGWGKVMGQHMPKRWHRVHETYKLNVGE